MRKQSVTIVEIVVASVIAMIIFASLLAVAVYVQSLLHKERRQLIAVEYINSILEDLMFSVDFDDDALSYGYHLSPIPDCPPPLALEGCFWSNFDPIVSYTVSVFDIDTVDPAPSQDESIAKQIDIVVTWTETIKGEAKQRSQSLSSIKLKD